jgi:TolA-binding protein
MDPLTRRSVSDRRNPRLLYVLAAIVVVGSLFLAHELGRLNGGYSVLDQRRERNELTAAIAERDQKIEELQRTIAILQTSQDVDQETYAQVERTLDELQARIQAQEEELAFYRGIISPEDGVAGLRVQALELRPTEGERAFLLHLVLVQAITHDRRVSGTVSFSFTGSVDGEPVRYNIADLVAGDAQGDLAYAFRYFQDLQRQLVLPDAFEPDEVLMEIRPREPSGEMLAQSFEWSAIIR